MIPTAPLASTYQNVFVEDQYSWLPMVLLVVSVLLIALGGILATSEKKKTAVTGRTISVVTLVASFAFMAFGPNLAETTLTNMNANLTQKYNATLTNPDPKETVKLDEPQAYQLTFSNGKIGTYTMKWDKNTSEPFILDTGAPTPDQLNQTSNK